MGFKISDLKKTVKNKTYSAEVDFKLGDAFDGQELKLELTVDSGDEEFATALTQAQQQNHKRLTKDSLRKGNQPELSVHEAMLYVIGEFAVSKWNATDEDDNEIAPSGDNFLKLLNFVGEDESSLVPFINKVLEVFTKLMQDMKADNEKRSEQVAKTAKKPSKSGSTRAK